MPHGVDCATRVIPPKFFCALLIVYLVWGSSFLFTRYVPLFNLPPVLFAGVRFITAGVVLVLIAELRGHSRLPRRLIEWRHVAIAGFFMVFISNGLNTWSIPLLGSVEAAVASSYLGVLDCGSWRVRQVLAFHPLSINSRYWAW